MRVRFTLESLEPQNATDGSDQRHALVFPVPAMPQEAANSPEAQESFDTGGHSSQSKAADRHCHVS